MNYQISLNEAARLISTIGESVTVVLRGEPGIGKSSVLKMLKQMHGDKYNYVYLDCPLVSDGDLAMRIPDHETKTLQFFTMDWLKQSVDKPLIIMLDELFKVSKNMTPLFTRLMLERVLGDIELPKGSIVFGTSNLGSDGVNDVLQGHVGNRITEIEIAKPNHKQFNVWATNNGVSTVTRTMIQLKPSLLHSYRTISADMLKDNPYIFNPTNRVNSFFSPRSAVKADEAVKNRHILGEDLTRATLAGTVGAAAAELYTAFINLDKDLTPIETIIKSPMEVAIPASVGAVMMTLFNAIDSIDTQDELVAFLKFVNRLQNEEYKDVFMSMLCESQRTAAMAFKNNEVSKWYQDNYKVV